MIQEQGILYRHPVSGVLRDTLLSAFTFLTALAFRDLFIRTFEVILPGPQVQSLLFTYMYTCMIALLTTVLAYVSYASS